MPGFFGYSECAKIAKNLSPFMAADFSLFCHGSALGGPHVPRTPLRWAAALPVALWSGKLLEYGAMPTGLFMYKQLNTRRTHPHTPNNAVRRS